MTTEARTDPTSPNGAAEKQPRSSRQRYLKFVADYKQHRLDKSDENGEKEKPAADSEEKRPAPSVLESLGIRPGKRREYAREYLNWLWPHRWSIAAVFGFALGTAGLEMIEPLFMRFIIDRVLLNSELESAKRLVWLHTAGALFVGVVVLSQAIGVLKDYRQRLLNTRVMLSLRRALFERLLHLPLSKLWDMKTGGILSRLTGDVDTTTGLLQMAIVSPSISLIRLTIAVGVLCTLNWRLALMALAIIPGAMLMSFVFARRIRPIYRTVRKDVEEIDGRVGETFSGIRVVRAFGREIRELLEYMVGRHTVLRKELFAHRRELILWTSWGLLVSGVNVVIVWYGGYLNVVGPQSATSWRFSGTRFCCSIRSGTLSTRFPSCSGRWRRWSECLRPWRWSRICPIGLMRATRRMRCARSVSRTWSSSTAKAGPSLAISTSLCPAAR
jgi:ATP-binding cassette subfamily B protein/subfamily B ATP-binding cassette protein MsbA